MKIAIVHNDYAKFSGEEAVIRDHEVILRNHENSVVFFRRSSAELHGLSGAAKGFFLGPYNPFIRKIFLKFLVTENPDIVHIHNLYPLITPSILGCVAELKIPLVMTVHNYRLFCPCGLFFQNGTICEECANTQSAWPCLRHNCLNSRFKTLGYAVRFAWERQRQYYQQYVDRFLCLTEFQRHKLIEYGINAERCRVVPNFIGEEWWRRARDVSPSNGKYVAYMGRLGKEKGIEIILEAARKLPDIPFRLAGAGAECWRSSAPSNVEFTGYLTGKAQFEFMHHARLNIMASCWYECFPTTLLQSMALGIPCLVPRLGGMPEIIRGAGIAYAPGNLAEVIEQLWNNEPLRQTYVVGAQKRIEDFSPEVGWKHLRESYAF